jgi:histidyl-tRNA synthetase
MAYANKLGVPFAVLLGEDEIAAGKCSVKNMTTGQQVTVTAAEAADMIKTAVTADIPVILEK